MMIRATKTLQTMSKIRIKDTKNNNNSNKKKKKKKFSDVDSEWQLTDITEGASFLN